MDEKIWHKAQRGFPFNIPLWLIISVSLGTPLLMAVVLIEKENKQLWTTNLITIAVSVLSYFLTDRLILQFKKSLEDNGLFGIDLNKFGKREDKPKV